ncbi:phage terminase small subunit [Pectinatus haikarae]|uniref:Uncharacterized protein YjcR n=1 Tax=Pectinatus haikarae TaxID=349096 RepID=A0ABT9Y3T7_9FIRM|nr:phage terminase small subunit [Pectinatus haikarae]MDQ0202491.1 uncharacterized protein YjcR [Pectinatus haikarae]
MTEQQEQAYKDYQAGMKYKDIAAKYNVSINTVNSWKKRHGWSKNGAPKSSAPKTKNGAPSAKSSALFGNKNAVGHGAPLGNKNAAGNRGGHAPPGNHNALRHGLYAKYLTEDTMQIMDAIENTGISDIDLLWDSILFKYSQILRSQKIMNVKDQEDIVKHVKSESDTSTTYEFQFPWDRQASYMHALSASMRTLTTMIKEYEDLCRSSLVTEEQQLRIEKLKGDINTGNGSEQQSAAMNSLINTLRAARGD